MNYYIDRFIVFRNVVFCDGWFSGLASPNASILVLIDDRTFTPELRRVTREDLRNAFGRGAEHWGFRLRCMLSDDVTADFLRHVKLKLSDGSKTQVIEAPAQQRAGVEYAELMKAQRTFFDAISSQPAPKILEIGSRARSGIVRRALFPEKAHYVGFDIKEGPNVEIVGDAHRLSSYVNDRFHFVYCIATFEHLAMPWKVAIEINRVLEPGGLVFVQSHQTWPIHDEPWDFWRFSKHAWRALFNDHTGFEILAVAHSEPAVVLPALQTGNPITMLENEIGYLGSSCLARKIGDAQVSWEVDASTVTQGIYPA